MDDKNSPKSANHLKGFMKKAQEAIKVVIGNSEVYSQEDAGGDLKFNPSIMMKINVTFDKEFLPKEKVVKLNVRGKHFFNDLKRNIREINSIFIIYPQQYDVQFDVRRQEWEKQLIKELNDEYHLNLKKIHFKNEEDVCRIYQRSGITNIRNPYNLKNDELLIVAGGFVNFDIDSQPLCSVKVNLTKEPKTKDGKIKYPLEENYYDKYSSNAGAYFFVGGEWYHNLFIPELYHREDPRFFSFRIAEDLKSVKFFSDQKVRGIDIRSDEKMIVTGDMEKIIYFINPDYLAGSGINDFKLIVTYDTKDIEVIDEKAEAVEAQELPITPVPEIIPPAPEEKVPVVDTASSMENILIAPSAEVKISKVEVGQLEEEPSVEEDEGFPYLENEMILLPCPKDDDIASYIMTIGSGNKNIQFYTNSLDNEVSILTMDKDEKILKRKIEDKVEFSTKMDSVNYSVTNSFMSRIDDKELKLYFGWELKSNVKERISLKRDFYILGREPLDNLALQMKSQMKPKTYDRLIYLNKGDEDFWRIGASRDHALLLKKEDKFILYNISQSYPVYILKPAAATRPLIHLTRIEPVPDAEKKEKLSDLLGKIKEAAVNDLLNQPETPGNLELATLHGIANWTYLENNDLIVIGNKVFKLIVPMVMESFLSDKVRRSILRKIQHKESVLR